MTTDVSKWGYKNMTKWALVEAAPLTASGLNEIICTATTKDELLMIKQLFKLRGSGYAMVKLADMMQPSPAD